MSLEGKVVILTGASSGIGEAVSLELGRHQATVVLAARRKERLEDVAKKVEELGGKALVVQTDLLVQKQITRLVETTIKTFGKIDVLINNAGWGAYAWFENYTPEELFKQYSVNVLAVAELTRQVIPHMKKRRSGHIINIVSYASRIAIPPLTVYASTKYAVEGLSDALRRELAIWGIRVTRVHPSSVKDTEFNHKAAARGGVNYKSFAVGRISREYLARRVVDVLYRPRRELFVSQLYDVPAFINRYFPWVVDLFFYFWMKRMRRGELVRQQNNERSQRKGD